MPSTSTSIRRRGSGQHRKISEQQVAEAARRHAAGETKRSLARAFGVSASVLGERLKKWQAAQAAALATRERWLEQLRAASAELEVLNRPSWSPRVLAGAPGWSLSAHEGNGGEEQRTVGSSEDGDDDANDTTQAAAASDDEPSDLTRGGEPSSAIAPWSFLGIGPHAPGWVLDATNASDNLL